jgi:VWFA-related protein
MGGRTRWFAVTTVFASAFAVLQAQSRQQLPTFRSTVEAVVLDVSVLDKDRNPIRGLKAIDFTVIEDGAAQTITTFNAIDFQDPVPEPGAAAWTQEVPSDVSTNADADNKRIVAIVMDDASPMPAVDVLHARATARKVIEALGPSDLACLVFALNQRHGQGFTTDKKRLLAAAERFNGAVDNTKTMARDKAGTLSTIPFDKFDLSNETLYRSAIGSVKRVSQQLSALPDRRKALVFISTGLPFDVEQAQAKIVHDENQGVMAQLILDLQNAFREAGEANVNVYSLDPGGLRAPYDSVVASATPANPGFLNRQFLSTVAESTGGFAIVETNDALPGVKQALRENASYYLLSYVSSNRRAEGRQRSIDVRVNRPGATVRSRKGYTEPKPPEAGNAPKVTNAASVADLTTALLPKRDLSLSIAAVPFALPGRAESAVAVVLGVSQASPATRTPEAVDIVTRAISDSGDLRGSATQTVQLVLRPNGGSPASYEVLSRIELKPGRYSLRAAAHARTADKTGSVYCDIDVPDYTKPRLSLSGIILSMNPGAVTAPKDALSSLIPVVPTTLREFDRRGTLTAFARIYQGAGRAPSAVTATMRVVDSVGRSILESTEEIGPSRLVSGPPFGVDWKMAVQIDRLREGRYLLIVEAKAGADAVRREVRFTAR